MEGNPYRIDVGQCAKVCSGEISAAECLYMVEVDGFPLEHSQQLESLRMKAFTLRSYRRHEVNCQYERRSLIEVSD